MDDFDSKNRYEEEFEKLRQNDYSESDIKTVLNNENVLFTKVKKGLLKTHYEQIRLMFSMLQDYISGEYKEIPKASIVPVVWTLFYIINPVDLVWDGMPVLGHLDDVAIITLCLRFVAIDLEKYKKWKANSESLNDNYKETKDED